MMQSKQMKRLRIVLDAYGADPGRWPAVDRDELVAFVAKDVEARAFFDAEAGFDRLMSSAQAVADQAPTERAKASLFARLDADPQDHGGTHAGNVVPFVPKSSAKASLRIAEPGASPRGLLKELSVLAAALLIGFFTVSQGLLDGAGLDLGGDSVVASGDPYDAGEVALGIADNDAAEEDLL